MTHPPSSHSASSPTIAPIAPSPTHTPVSSSMHRVSIAPAPSPTQGLIPPLIIFSTTYRKQSPILPLCFMSNPKLCLFLLKFFLSGPLQDLQNLGNSHSVHLCKRFLLLPLIQVRDFFQLF